MARRLPGLKAKRMLLTVAPGLILTQRLNESVVTDGQL